MTTITRQGFEQIALALLVGALVFGALAFRTRRRGDPWRRGALSGGILLACSAVALTLGYTIAPNIPTPSVPLTARFASNPVPDTQASWQAGQATFAKSCAICHGPRGLGDGPQAFVLNPKPFNLQVHVPLHAPGELEYWMSEGIPGTAMPAWKDILTETQRWELVRFLNALAAGRI